MHSNTHRLAAVLLAILMVAPAALAQEDASMEDADAMAGVHVHQGTISTPGGGNVLEITYEISMADEGHVGWIVGAANGQEFRLEMRDLEMDHDEVTYNWSPPGSDLIISCELEAVEEGGWSGECIDNEDGDTGLMSMSPMSGHGEGADHDDADDHADHDDADDHADHDDADDSEDDGGSGY